MPDCSFGLDEDLQVRLGVRIAADFGEQERIDVAAGRDEIQVAADSGLRGMDVAEIVRSVDDPEFLVAGREVENLFFLGQDDER